MTCAQPHTCTQAHGRRCGFLCSIMREGGLRCCFIRDPSSSTICKEGHCGCGVWVDAASSGPIQPSWQQPSLNTNTFVLHVCIYRTYGKGGPDLWWVVATVTAAPRAPPAARARSSAMPSAAPSAGSVPVPTSSSSTSDRPSASRRSVCHRKLISHAQSISPRRSRLPGVMQGL